MRQVVLDTETTGLEVQQGHRLIEIACLELVDRKLTGQRVHHYINPERTIDAGASRIHGICDEDVRDAPLFARIAEELIGFVRDADVLIHNAPFDTAFLDAELAQCGLAPFASHCAQITDTLKMAREMRPGKSNSLDALCREFGVSNAARTWHGALLDAQLLADVYLAMTRGQESLGMDLQPTIRHSARNRSIAEMLPLLPVAEVSQDEQAAHAALLVAIEKESKNGCLWARTG